MTQSDGGTAPDGGATTARVRGIYATALTCLFRDAGIDVVAASPPIQRRFDADFPVAEPDADVWMTDDRQGVGVTVREGADTTADTFRDALGDVGRDAFVWADRAARGAVFHAVVDRTLGSGAVVDLGGGREAFLPFDAVDRYVDEGDALRVQVHDPKPPWGRDRPVVGTRLHAHGAIATLDRGVDALVAGAQTDEQQLARTTELLDPDVPGNWGVFWQYDAADAEMSALGDALDALSGVAATIEDAVADAAGDPDGAADAGDPDEAAEGSAPERLVAPEQTLWAWFGRESRFALDDARRAVAPTMPGHHRVKAGTEAASAAVDFAEALGVDGAVDDFPFAAVTDQFGPTEGDEVRLLHGKPDGSLFALGRGEVTGRDVAKQHVTVEREMSGGGSYDALGVERAAGDVATTRFTEGNWWYPTVYRGADGTVRGTYLNVCTPVELFPDAVRYVDLHVDVVKHADGTVEVVDEDELHDCVDDGLVGEELAEKALAVAQLVRSAAEN